MSTCKIVCFLFAILAGASIAGAQSIHVKPTARPDAVAKNKILITMTVSGQEVTTSAKVETTVKAGPDGTLKYVDEYKEFSIEVGGGAGPEVALSPLEAQVDTAGELKRASGGPEGADPAVLFLMTHFVAPDKDLAPGDSYSLDFRANAAAAIPELKYEGTYIGPDKVDGVDAQKFTLKCTQMKSDGLKTDMTFWVLESGQVLKCSGKFQGFWLPIVSQSADGTVEETVSK
jgi:hypothetical protein